MSYKFRFSPKFGKVIFWRGRTRDSMDGWEGYIVSGIYSPEKFSIQISSHLGREHWIERTTWGRGLFVIGNGVVLDWFRGSWVFIILLKEKRKVFRSS